MKDKIPTRLRCDSSASNSSETNSPQSPQMSETDLPPHSPTNLPIGERNFTKFGKLPVEIRLLIWALALQALQPRTIQISATVPHYPIRGRTIPKAKAHSASVPSLLHASSDARIIAQKSYRLILSEQLDRKPIYFDFSRDTLYLDGLESLLSLYRTPFDDYYFSNKSSTAMVNIENELRTLIYATRLHPQAIEVLTNFKSLKVLVYERTLDLLMGYRPTGVVASVSPLEQYTMSRLNQGFNAKALSRGDSQFSPPRLESSEYLDYNTRVSES